MLSYILSRIVQCIHIRTIHCEFSLLVVNVETLDLVSVAQYNPLIHQKCDSFKHLPGISHIAFLVPLQADKRGAYVC